MTKTGRNAAVGLVATAVMTVAGRANAQDDRTGSTAGPEATIVLHVTNYANLSHDILNVAMARVANVYHGIGVSIAWVEDNGSVKRRQDGQLHLNVLLLSPDMAEKIIEAADIEDGVLGLAHPEGGRASIFCDRIATAPGAPMYLPIPLGDVIAHEVGHLLLGANSHSAMGIMRAHTNVHGLHLQGFDKRQADTIRRTLTSARGSVPTAGR
jgi:hypothetical protein